MISRAVNEIRFDQQQQAQVQSHQEEEYSHHSSIPYVQQDHR